MLAVMSREAFPLKSLLKSYRLMRGARGAFVTGPAPSTVAQARLSGSGSSVCELCLVRAG